MSIRVQYSLILCVPGFCTCAPEGGRFEVVVSSLVYIHWVGDGTGNSLATAAALPARASGLVTATSRSRCGEDRVTRGGACRSLPEFSSVIATTAPVATAPAMIALSRIGRRVLRRGAG